MHFALQTFAICEALSLLWQALSINKFMQDPPPPPTHFNVSRRQKISDSSSTFWDSCSQPEKVIFVLVLFLVMWNIILMGIVGATLHRVVTRL